MTNLQDVNEFSLSERRRDKTGDDVSLDKQNKFNFCPVCRTGDIFSGGPIVKNRYSSHFR